MPDTVTARPTDALLDLDPELGVLLAEDRLDAARRELMVHVHALPVAEWPADRLASIGPEHVGLLVVDGALCREVLIADTVSAELLGAGDVVRPWRLRPESALVPLRVRWRALAPTRIAVLDRRVGGMLSRYPEVNAVLLDRLSERAARLATSQAISQLTRVDRRLLALLWHMAERWGRVGPDGVVLPLTLSHQLLGELVGARRPTVSAALAELGERGEVTRQGDGTWLLGGDHADIAEPPGGASVPPRRRFLPAVVGPDRELHPEEEEEEVEAPMTNGAARDPSEALAEMLETLHRVQASCRSHVEELRLTCLRSTELCARTAELRGSRSSNAADPRAPQS
jgi:CRP/FNR family cyclic AMP-dependent transcriptional regulator